VEDSTISELGRQSLILREGRLEDVKPHFLQIFFNIETGTVLVGSRRPVIVVKELEIRSCTHRVKDLVQVYITSIFSIAVVEGVADPLEGSLTDLTLLAID